MTLESEEQTTYRKSPNRHTTNKAMLSAKSKSLENIRSSPYSSINSNRDAACSDCSAVSQGIKSRRGTVDLPTAMIGNYNSVKTVGNS